MLRTLDLFSGVGGLTRALHGLATPVAYCEREDNAKACLGILMTDGRLPPAPICPDVAQLDRAWLEQVSVGPGCVDAIIGGFPCVGMSNLGKRQGFENEQSALWVHILRLADELQAPLLFLENVEPILRLGMDAVVQELAMKRGYELRWCVASAADVGAPQERARWFCLAIRPGFAFTWAERSEYEPFGWGVNDLNNFSHVAHRSDRAAKISHALMGNSVVPDAVRWAFLQLASGFNQVAELSTPAGFTLAAVTDHAGQDVAVPDTRWPKRGCLATVGENLVLRKMPAVQPFRPQLKLYLEMDPTVCWAGKVPSKALKLPVLETPFLRTTFCTPLHSAHGHPNYMTKRSSRMLNSQITMWTKTPAEMRPAQASSDFVEWLMGYPLGWTYIGE